jgi:hypothetical protein
MLGTIALRDGQVVLSGVTPSVIGQGVLPLSPNLSTAQAASANSGQLDAALVRISNAVIVSVGSSNGETVLTVSDGSGLVDVLLDRDVGFQPSAFALNRVINATGVLVPIGPVASAGWRLKPRNLGDVVVLPPTP